MIGIWRLFHYSKICLYLLYHIVTKAYTDLVQKRLLHMFCRGLVRLTWFYQRLVITWYLVASCYFYTLKITPWFFQIEWLFEYSKILTHHHAITVLQIFLYWKCSQRLVSNLLFVWRYPGVAEMFICIFNLDLLLCDLLKCHVLYPAVL